MRDKIRIVIVARGEYHARKFPPEMRTALLALIQNHMNAYELTDVELTAGVVVEPDDSD